MVCNHQNKTRKYTIGPTPLKFPKKLNPAPTSFLLKFPIRSQSRIHRLLELAFALASASTSSISIPSFFFSHKDISHTVVASSSMELQQWWQCYDRCVSVFYIWGFQFYYIWDLLRNRFIRFGILLCVHHINMTEIFSQKRNSCFDFWSWVLLRTIMHPWRHAHWRRRWQSSEESSHRGR